MKVNRRTLTGTSGATVAAAIAGSLAMRSASEWYVRLRKPAFQPPGVVFPVVWPLLYADVAVSSAIVLDQLSASAAEDERRAFARALALNLALNAAWTWVFFRAQRPALATVESALLALSSADLVRRAAAVDRRAAIALSPYAGWTAYATVLAAAIAGLNRRR